MRSIVEKTLAGLPVTVSEDVFFVIVRHKDMQWSVSQLTVSVDGVRMDAGMFREYVENGILMAERADRWTDGDVDWQPPTSIRMGRTHNGLLTLRDRAGEQLDD